ncbi:MAG: phenylalanine--tRNA ligase subunit beta [Dehalococcoidales bacterium]|nr:phenylalanine--tRNA ligase subunit beta [Dehalococcoidales bacterium]
MKVSLKWLKDYLDINITPAELARRLTMAGCEPKEVVTIGGDWDNVVIGRIEAVNRHPNADKLNLVTVDVGEPEKQTVVCGAPNVAVGAKIAFGKVGARVNDPHSGKVGEIKPAKIRGVESSGMCLSEKELGISENHEGILILPEAVPIGQTLSSYLGDTVLDLEVTPNRSDCLSVIGVAREAAALTGQNIKLSEPTYVEGGSPIIDSITIEIEAKDLCPRYCASMITGFKIAPSPQWLQERLIAAGQRPINNIVDITNYVMLEYGQPLHSFDYNKIRGQKIIVRRAYPKEKLTTLDGVERTLSPDNLVIADLDRAVAIAGVMGGANSDVTENTEAILLESACFNAVNIHYTARTLRLGSEASQRFERGIRADLTIPALKRATQLILELAGGTAAKGIIDVYPGRTQIPPIVLPVKLVGTILDVKLEYDRIVSVLTSLGFVCEPNAAKTEIKVAVPYWRSDIKLPVDLVEEVGRIIGYDKIPLTMLSEPVPPQNPEPIIGLKRQVRRSLAGFGFQEIMSLSLVSGEWLKKLHPEAAPFEPTPLKLVNPMTIDQEYLRPTLRANLLAAVNANRRFEEGGLRFFEVSRVYLARPKELPDERETLCGVLAGLRNEHSWGSKNETVDFYDAKGVVEALLEQLNIAASFEPSDDAGLHASKQAAVMAGGNKIGVVGEVHPKVLINFEISEPIYMFELDMKTLVSVVSGVAAYRHLPRFPAVVRDVALVVDIEVTHLNITDVIRGFSLVKNIELFDVYSGEQVPAGKKSLAYRITFQSAERTLKEEEINGVMKGLLKKLAKDTGAVLRA